MEEETVEEEKRISEYHLGQAAKVGCAAGVFIILQSAVTLAVIAREPSLHNSVNILISSLAITNILIGGGVLILAPISIVISETELSSSTKLIFCSLTMGIYIAMIFALNFHMLIISITRLLQTQCTQFYQKRVGSRVLFLAFISLWFFSILCIIIPLCLPYHDVQRKCDFERLPSVYAVWLPFGMYVTTLVVTLTAHATVACVSCKKAVRVEPEQGDSESTPQPRSSRNLDHTAKEMRTKKSVKLFTLLFSTYFVLTFPTYIVQILNHVSYVHPKIKVTFYFLPVSFCSINMFAFAFMDQGFRNGAKQLFRDMINKIFRK